MMNLPNPENQCVALSEMIRPTLSENPLFVGLYRGGALVAKRVLEHLNLEESRLGFLDISFYRDDYNEKGLHKNIQPSQIPFSVENRNVILLDDVLYTGRTTRAALSEIFDYGRPKKVELAVLADRQGKELPIAPTYCVWNVHLPFDEKLHLSLENQKLCWSLQKNA